MQMICAPRFAASRIFSTARARFAAASFVDFICIRPRVNLSCIADNPITSVARRFHRSAIRRCYHGPRTGVHDRPMSLALYLLAALGCLGAFDTLYYHEWRAKLPSLGRAAHSELQLHAWRDF